MSVRVKSASRRKTSSTRWLQRQLNDPYVAEANRQGFRSRSAFKLIELDDRFHFLKPGQSVVDLGARPGGWSMVAAERVNAGGVNKGQPMGRVLAVDIEPMEPLAHVKIFEMDILDPHSPEILRSHLDSSADIVLTDMAAPSTGHKATDHLRIMGLLESAYDLAEEILNPGGAFIGKVLQGGAEKSLLDRLKQNFDQVRHAKPPASRKDSAETYLIALGFNAKP